MLFRSTATRTPGAPILSTPPFSPHDAPEIIGTAVFYHYINRMVSVLLKQSPLPLVPAPLTGTTARLAGWWFARAARRTKTSGTALTLLPMAPAPTTAIFLFIRVPLVRLKVLTAKAAILRRYFCQASRSVTARLKTGAPALESRRSGTQEPWRSNW